jgi:hypothetical protein
MTKLYILAALESREEKLYTVENLLCSYIKRYSA